MNNLLAILAFLILVGFLSVLVIHVPRADLGIVIALTVGLAGWDLILNLKAKKG